MRSQSRHFGPLAPIALSGIIAMLAGCSSTAATGGNPGLGPRLAPCPASPNCVSSTELNQAHHGPWKLAMPTNSAWPIVQQVVASMPRTHIVIADDSYLHATCRSRLLRFVDDLELAIDEDGQLAFRSASRLGYSDLGVNQQRIEALYEALKTRGVVH